MCLYRKVFFTLNIMDLEHIFNTYIMEMNENSCDRLNENTQFLNLHFYFLIQRPLYLVSLFDGQSALLFVFPVANKRWFGTLCGLNFEIVKMAEQCRHWSKKYNQIIKFNAHEKLAIHVDKILECGF